MRTASLSLACAAAVVLVVGCGNASVGQDPPVLAPAPPAATSTAHPVEFDVPSIQATSTLIPLGIQTDGQVQVPDVNHPEQAGWIQVATHESGMFAPIVLLGHVNGAGRDGVFSRLKDVDVGAHITVTFSDGVMHRYTVRRTQEIAKSAFPTASVYGPAGMPTLNLITCGGVLDRAHHNYLSSEIAYATEDQP